MTTQDMVDYHHELFNLVIYSITIKYFRSEVVFLGPPILIGGSMVTWLLDRSFELMIRWWKLQLVEFVFYQGSGQERGRKSELLQTARLHGPEGSDEHLQGIPRRSERRFAVHGCGGSGLGPSPRRLDRPVQSAGHGRGLRPPSRSNGSCGSVRTGSALFGPGRGGFCLTTDGPRNQFDGHQSGPDPEEPDQNLFQNGAFHGGSGHRTPVILRGMRRPELQSLPNSHQRFLFELSEIFQKLINFNSIWFEGYVSFVRSYATFPKDVRDVFDFTKLHLGHYAKSFALRDPPTQINSRGRGGQRNDKTKKFNTAAERNPKSALKRTGNCLILNFFLKKLRSSLRKFFRSKSVKFKLATNSF